MIRLMETPENAEDLGAAFLTDGAYMVHGDDLEGVRHCLYTIFCF